MTDSVPLSSLYVFLLYYKNLCPACSIQAYIQSLQSQSVKGSLYGAYFSAFAQLFTKHGRSSSTLPQHHPLPSFLNCSKTGPPISLKFGRSIRTGSPNVPSNFQAEIRSCPRETSRKSQYRSISTSVLCRFVCFVSFSFLVSLFISTSVFCTTEARFWHTQVCATRLLFLRQLVQRGQQNIHSDSLLYAASKRKQPFKQSTPILCTHIEREHQQR